MGAEAPRSRSLARTLLLLLVAGVGATWLATALSSYVEARHEIGELLDAHLVQVASLVLAEADEAPRIVDAGHAQQLHRYARRVAFQLWADGTRLGLHSANAPDARMSAREEGFSDVVVDGRAWRVFSAWDARRRHLVQVGERRDVRDEIVAKIARNLLVPLAVALPALALLLWLGIRRSLRPLTALGREIEARAPANLAPVDVRDAPIEVAPLVTSLDRLLARVAASIEHERRFTADAAHELRTPLAAIRAQAQVARSAVQDDERRHALDSVLAGCDRATHLVAQLLTLARLEPGGLDAVRERCDLGEVLRATIADAAQAAVSRGVDIELAAAPVSGVAGDARLLDILFRNLVDNAIRHAPPGSCVRVALAQEGGRVTASVADEGPGVPAAERAHLGRRFHRLVPGDGSGSGLGLSIATRIAEIHGARIAYEDASPGRGLAVHVSFPAAA
ncbi:MAG TPA: ATP-binding protein [Casimicrobiaceae bacterium]|nr:ATP-binding protein [Casimicrobiaceae bacterium]